MALFAAEERLALLAVEGGLALLAVAGVLALLAVGGVLMSFGFLRRLRFFVVEAAAAEEVGVAGGGADGDDDDGVSLFSFRVGLFLLVLRRRSRRENKQTDRGTSEVPLYIIAPVE